MPKSDVELKRWKRVEYEQLVEKGIFAPGDRVELIDGLLIVAEPQSATHYTAIKLVERALARAFGEGWHTRSQAPIALDETSEPEPDVAVVRGDLRAYTAAHPDDPVLVVEVALTSLALDREHKASLYARAGRPEYWIVNLVDRVLEVYRDPVPSPSAPYGWDYGARETLGVGDNVRPLAASTARVVVGDLLP
jgi:Uma2 family endonuclease